MTIDDLIKADRDKSAHIAVIGDAMTDVWVHGDVDTCQEGVTRLIARKVVKTPGGAANAARQLWRWNAETSLISPWAPPVTFTDEDTYRAWAEVSTDLVLERDAHVMPEKTRFLRGGQVIFRADSEAHGYGMSDEQMTEARRLAMLAVRSMDWDAILVSDYGKGFLSCEMLREIASISQAQGFPVVADATRGHPSFYPGMVLKCNAEYAARHQDYLCQVERHAVVTRGALEPMCHKFSDSDLDPLLSIAHGHRACVNHVGAGDCFAAHLTLCLAHGLTWSKPAWFGAVGVAHAAGQVYVEHEHGRAPWPFEIRKKATGSKVLNMYEVHDLAVSLSGKRVIFANGVWRIPHAGHAWLLGEAKKRGDVLVVGINDDVSAYRQKPGEFVLPLTERMKTLESMEAVDWIVPYTEDTPAEVLKRLAKPVLVKGSEYTGQSIPGEKLCSGVIFLGPSPYERHCSDLVKEIRD